MSVTALTTANSLLSCLKPVLRLISGLSVMALMVLSVRYCSQSTELTVAYEKQEEQYQEIVRLNTALALQNESIEQMNLQTEMAQIQAEAAMKVAQANNRSLTLAIDEIKSIQATECEATAPIVAKAINALRMGKMDD